MADRITRGLVISRLVRLASSVNGNPRYEVIFTDGTSARTEVDGSVAYGIGNSEYRETPLMVTFNGRGHITAIDRMDGLMGKVITVRCVDKVTRTIKINSIVSDGNGGLYVWGRHAEDSSANYPAYLNLDGTQD